ncbi:MAG: OmpA family protein [Polyangiaceae bacterium]
MPFLRRRGADRPRPRHGVASLFALFALFASAVAPSSARAQALDSAELTAPGQPFTLLESAFPVGRIEPRFGATVTYAHEPLVLETRAGDRIGPVVDHQVLLHLGAGVGVIDRLLFDVDAPFVLSEGGASPAPAFRSPSGAAAGDLRLGAQAILLTQDGGWPAISGSFRLWFPTGSEDRYAGSNGARLGVGASAGGDFEHVAWTASASAAWTTEPDDVVGSVVTVGAGVLAKIAFLRIGPEANVRLLVDCPASGECVGFEPVLTARAGWRWLSVGLFGGPGLGYAPSTPRFRLGLNVAVAFEAAPPVSKPIDRAGDGTKPEHVETKPVLDEGSKRDEKPPTDPRPEAPVDCAKDPSAKGCAPALVHVEGSQIVITEEVHFETGEAVIDPSSYALLEQVAAAITSHPEIARVAVDGHTDDRGSAERNLDLSRKRALAVVAWLNEHGVDPRRTEARGFGSRQPIADNTTDEGRARNRRVEFIILARTPLGPAGWRDGTIEPAPPPPVKPQ